MSVWSSLAGVLGFRKKQEEILSLESKKYAVSPAMFSQLGRAAPKDIVRWPEYATAGLTPEKLINITRNADQGVLQDQMALLQEIVGKDGLIQGLLSTRLSALSRKDVKVVPSAADADPIRAEDVAKYAQDILDRLKLAEEQIDGSYRYSGNISSVVEALAISTWYGLEVLWVHWGNRTGESIAKPLYLEPLDERRYAFDVQTQTTHISTVDSAVYPGIPLTAYDPALYLEVRNTRLTPRLSQCGSGRAVLLPYALRLGGMKDLLTYAEVWSLPGVVGKMDADVAAAFGPDSVASFQQMIEEFAGDSRQILPPGFDVEVLQAVSGGEKVFELLDKLTERQIQFAIVGQTGTASGDTATYASAAVGMQLQQTLTAGDERMVAEALEGLLANAIKLSFGPNVPTPTVTFQVDTGQDALVSKTELLTKITPVITALLDKGVAVDIEQLAKIYDIPLKVPTNG